MSFGSPTARSLATAQGLDPAALLKIQSLELRARAVVEGFMAGLHRSPYQGFSVEFSDYRPYTVGDDLRFLDWRLLARSDRRYVKRFEEETNLRAYLVLDHSASMNFASQGITKAEYARTLVATLSYFLMSQRDAVGLVTFADQVTEFLPARFRTGHWRQLLVQLERAQPARSTAWRPPLEKLVQLFRQRGVVVLFSDFLSDLRELDSQLGYLRALRHEVILVRILDPQELDLAGMGAGFIEDLETGRRLFVDAPEAQAGYRRKFAQHERELAQICERRGVRWYRYLTTNPLDHVLFDLVCRPNDQGPRAITPRGIAGENS